MRKQNKLEMIKMSSKIYKLGVIGLGSRVTNFFEDFRMKWEDWVISTVADPDTEAVKNRMEKFPGYFAEDVHVYTNADEMLEKEEVDAIVIGTRCALHTEMAIKAMPKKVPIFLEKPVAISFEQLHQLEEANKKYKPMVLVSFPGRYSKHVQMAKEIIESGEIGEIIQVDAVNDVPYGRVYYHNWYQDETLTGGLWLQKATHDFDMMNYLLGEKAKAISAFDARKFFGGNEPIGLKCEDCPKQEECPESVYTVKNVYEDPYGSSGTLCCYSKNVSNQECGTAIVKYESGIIATYTQNFVARMHSERRGMRIYGYKGVIEYDFFGKFVKVYSNVSPNTRIFKVYDDGHHYGGDLYLAQQFKDIITRKDTKSTLEEGMESARMCLYAEKSCRTDETQKIERG